ncbi:tetratricopeptide repeat protein [Thermodesulfobacteriota bacterium]
MYTARQFVLCFLIICAASSAGATVTKPLSDSNYAWKHRLKFERVSNGLYRGFVTSADNLLRLERRLQKKIPKGKKYTLAYCPCKKKPGTYAVAYSRSSRRVKRTRSTCLKLAQLQGGCYTSPVIVALTRNARRALTKEKGLKGASGPKSKRAIASHFERSSRYEKGGNLSSALEEINGILRADPKNYTATLRSGWLHYREGRHEDSVTQYRKAVSLKPKAIEPRLGLLLPLAALKRWKDLESAAREVTAIDPKNYKANKRLAEALRAQGRHEQAGIITNGLAKLYPLQDLLKRETDKKIEQKFNRSVELGKLRDNQGALIEVRGILAQHPDNYPANLRAAWLYHQQGDSKNAMLRYRKAAALAPNAIEPLLGQLRVLTAGKRWKEIVKTARKVLAVDPKNYTAKSCLAFANFSLKRYAQALQDYKQLVQFYPADTDMQLGLAWTWFWVGNKSIAQSCFMKVLQVQPDNKKAKQGIQAIMSQLSY